MSDADELLRLRLRVEALEHEVSEARRQHASVRTELDAMERSRAWRAIARTRGLARRLRQDVVVAEAAGREPRGVTRLPLLGLPADAGGAPVRWADEVTLDGVALPALLADAPTTVAYTFEPSSRLRFRTFAGVRTDVAVGNVGGMRFVAAVHDETGRELARAERRLDPGGDPADRRWHALTLDLPAAPGSGQHRLVLVTALPEGAEADYAWGAWGDPVLLAGAAERFAAARRTLQRFAPARKRAVEQTGPAPEISLLLPVHDPPVDLLERTIASVLGQTSPRWQLCISDDGSQDPQVRAILDRAAAADERVLLTRADTPAGISAATNAALGLAGGEFVAPLDHDDTLAPGAIAAVGTRLGADPSLDMLYTDNDKEVPGAGCFAPAFKPDWSPEYLRACMYTLHLGVYRRSLVQQLGGWRSAFDGAQDHDLVLRLCHAGARVGHEPTVQYHWGVHAGSTAQGADAKPEAFERGVAAVEDHLRRSGTSAHAVRLRPAGRYRVVYEPDPGRTVDVVLPPDMEISTDMVEALRRPGVRLFAVGAAPAGVERDLTVVARPEGAWGAAAAAGVRAGSASVVVVLEDPVVPDGDEWLDELAGLTCEPGVGAVGALVVDHAGRTVHAGVALPRGVPLPVHLDADPAADDAPPELTMVTNRSAAAGVVAFDRAALEAAGGIPALERHALAAATLGVSRVVITPHARFRLLADRPRSAVISPDELVAIAAGRAGRRDPYYSPNLWPDRAAHVVPAAWQREGRSGAG